MTRPTRLTPEELEKVKKLLALAQNKNGRVACGVAMSSMVDLVYGGIPGLFRHIAALDEEIEDLCKTRKDLHYIVTEQSILLHQLERK